MNKKTLIILATAIFTLLCGCTNQKTHVKYVESVRVDGFKEDESTGKIKISEEECNTFILSFKDIDSTDYPYSELFMTDEALLEKKQFDTVASTHTFDFFNGKKTVDSDNLFSVVKKNNKDFRNGSVEKNFYKEFSDKKLKEYCQMISAAVNWRIENDTDFDFDRVGCLLGNLKILEKNSMNMGGFNPENGVLTIVPSMIKAHSKTHKNGTTPKQTITHEAMHIMQSGCCDTYSSDGCRLIGISYKFGDLTVNPLFIPWLYEGSAELNTSHLLNIEPTTYTSYIDYIESINLATLLNEELPARQTENVSFHHDADVLYKQLGFDDEKKAADFLYSIEIVSEKPDEFFKAYETIDKIPENKSEFVNKEIKPIVCETISIIFYKNLAEALTKKEMSLNDIFYLISMHELDTQKRVNVRAQEERIMYKPYIDEYIKLQNSFFEMLQKYTDSNIKEYFLTYRINYEDNGLFANAALDFIDEDKKQYLADRNESLYNKYFKKMCEYTDN